MVARKPALDDGTSQTGRMEGTRPEGQWPAADSDPGADIWGDESHGQHNGSKQMPTNIPDALRRGMPQQQPTNYSSIETEENVWGEPAPGNTVTSGRGGGSDVNRVPTVLRPGGGLRPETNPFKIKRKPSASTGGPPQESNITQAQPPTDAFAQLNVDDAPSNPWKPATVEDSRPGAREPVAPTLIDTQSEDHIWDSTRPSPQPSPAPASASPVVMSLPSDTGSSIWDEGASKQAAPPPAAKVALDEAEILEESHAWDDLGSLDKGKGPAKPPPPLPLSNSGGRIDEWNLIDVDDETPKPLKRQDTWENFDDDDESGPSSTSAPAPASATAPQPTSQEEAPSLPPRRAADQPTSPGQARPPRPAGDGQNETYQIKNIRWHDSSAANNPRVSPIILQNANGPCPLVALVNALTMTTPAEEETALVETLRTREHISLNLLVDAVFDELMSGRRCSSNDTLPDVPELYDFLKDLQTGMNVNPRFVPTPENIAAYKRTSLTHLHPTERADDMIPGTFEDTREMSLYSIFSIPLIHGWLPSKAEQAYEAFKRRAASYEEVQNLLFLEEELEDKLSNPSQQGLTEQEQEIYQDILTIKSFLSMYPTQLTPWGLNVISQAMKPGLVAILFRNDHFSTLYRHPQSQQLLTLVTDAGYATHDEVVWESLVDVNGEHAEFFSGDFRVVGGAGSSLSGANSTGPAAGRGEWTTVQGRRGRNQTLQNPTGGDSEVPRSPDHEQEDRDLALALQLQEEEDERHRAEQARRRRESQLSEQFIEQQGRQPSGRGGPGRGGSRSTASSARDGRGGASLLTPAPNPSRRSSSAVNTPVTQISPNANSRPRAATQTVRSLIPPVRGAVAVNRPADEGDDEAPPSYEQAAKAPAYNPPPGNPAAASSSTLSSSLDSRPSLAPIGSSTGRTASNVPGRPPTGSYIRQGIPPSPAAMYNGGDRRDRDCVVM
ncbi:hypothetical protein DL546_002139 [Coniochaeta pulveracea]|uniref:MINDY deubiquitinase domain-containing protein n=1 Tax=Coniochaeta pulveracea TaxID=177199 RepID=A0A420XYZ7_9PEZI|nr:hypothetical protein DL546_002139 [Coniochaeta pulveracea]